MKMNPDTEPSGPELTACRNPPSTITGVQIAKGLDFSSRRIQVTSIAVIILLVLTPLFVGIYFIYLNPPRALVEINPGEDTFVSTIESEEHSHESFVRVSNYTLADEEIVEIGLYKFFYFPPPGGGGLTDAIFSFHCDVVTPGEIELHIMTSEGLWSLFETDLTNLTYSSIPLHQSIPVTRVNVDSNRTYSVSIFGSEGLEHEPSMGIIGIYVAAMHDTRIILDSFEALEESHRPKLMMYMGIGILVQNPFVYYLQPVFLIPVLASLVIALYLIRQMKQHRTDR